MREPDMPTFPESAEVGAITSAPQHDLTSLVVPLLKSVLYRDEDPQAWAALLKLQARLRDYVAVLALDLVLDEAEGYAFLRARSTPDDAASGGAQTFEFSGQPVAGALTQKIGRVRCQRQ